MTSSFLFPSRRRPQIDDVVDDDISRGLKINPTFDGARANREKYLTYLYRALYVANLIEVVEVAEVGSRPSRGR